VPTGFSLTGEGVTVAYNEVGASRPLQSDGESSGPPQWGPSLHYTDAQHDKRFEFEDISQVVLPIGQVISAQIDNNEWFSVIAPVIDGEPRQLTLTTCGVHAILGAARASPVEHPGVAPVPPSPPGPADGPASYSSVALTGDLWWSTSAPD
jgi:hypothetical protein